MRCAWMGALLLGVVAAPAAHAECNVVLRKAHVWTGKDFETRDLSIAAGKFTAAAAGAADVDASWMWLIPEPFADAHNHGIDQPPGRGIRRA